MRLKIVSIKGQNCITVSSLYEQYVLYTIYNIS